MLRTGTLALAAVIAALLMGGASAHAAAEAPPANDNLADALLLTDRTGVFLAARVEATKEFGEPNPVGVSVAPRLGTAGTRPRKPRGAKRPCQGGGDVIADGLPSNDRAHDRSQLARQHPRELFQLGSRSGSHRA